MCFLLSWPQEALISLPRVRLTVAAMPLPANMSAKDCCLLMLLLLKPVPSTALTGIRFTWLCVPLSFCASSRAHSSESLTPLMMAYS